MVPGVWPLSSPVDELAGAVRMRLFVDLSKSSLLRFSKLAVPMDGPLGANSTATGSTSSAAGLGRAGVGISSSSGYTIFVQTRAHRGSMWLQWL